MRHLGSSPCSSPLHRHRLCSGILQWRRWWGRLSGETCWPASGCRKSPHYCRSSSERERQVSELRGLPVWSLHDLTAWVSQQAKDMQHTAGEMEILMQWERVCVSVCVRACVRASECSLCVSAPVAQWLERCVGSAKFVGSIPREHMYWQYKCITWMHCKSLWIKASDKCINVNVSEWVSECVLHTFSPRVWMDGWSFHCSFLLSPLFLNNYHSFNIIIWGVE